MPTPKSEIKAFRSRLAKLSDKDIGGIKHLMILGLRDRLATESFIFAHGAWRGFSILPSRPRPQSAGVFVPQTERKVVQLPAGGWPLPRVFKDHRGKPAFTFLEVHGGEGLVMETKQAVGWNELTKDEILGAVKWFQEWK